MADNTTQNPQAEGAQGFPDFTESADGGNEKGKSKLDAGMPAVGASPGKTFAILAVLILGAASILYMIFGGDEPPPPEIAKGPSTSPVEKSLPPPQIPSAPVVDVPPPSPAPPVVNIPPPNATPTDVEVGVVTPDESARKAREQAQSVVLKGGGGLFGGGRREAPEKPPEYNDPNSAFMANAIRTSEAETATATIIGGLGHTVAQGKVIDCVLESAVNTDLPGTIRAIVSHDIYAEHGRDVLIPRGARLIGTYNSGVTRGQKRVFMVWTRMIRPDGVDIQLGSPGTDPLGRSGVEGNVDNKFMELFSGAVLTSVLAFGAASIIEATTDNPNTSTSNSTGAGFGSGSVTTQQGSPTAIAANQFTNQTFQTGKSLVDSYLNVNPTITIPQGTVMKVFVNRDLIFPPSLTRQQVMIP